MKCRRQIALVSVGVYKVGDVCPGCCHEATGNMLLCIYIGYLVINLGLVQLGAVKMNLPNCALRLQSNKECKCWFKIGQQT